MRENGPCLGSSFCCCECLPQGQSVHQVIGIDVFRHRAEQREDIMFLHHASPCVDTLEGSPNIRAIELRIIPTFTVVFSRTSRAIAVRWGEARVDTLATRQVMYAA